MAQNDPTVLGIAGAGLEYTAGHDARPPWIIFVGVGARRIGHHLRRDHDGGLRVEERHLVGDGGHMPVHE
jgi:hypothetical protein